MNEEGKEFFEKYKCRIYEIIEQETQVERKEKTEKKIENIIPIFMMVIFLLYNFINILYGYDIDIKQDILFIELLKSIFVQLIVYVITYSVITIVLIKLKYRKIAYIITHIISLFSSYLFFELFNIVIQEDKITWYNIVFAFVLTILWILFYVINHKKTKQKYEQLAAYDYKMMLDFQKIIENESNKRKEVIRLNFKKKKIKKK